MDNLLLYLLLWLSMRSLFKSINLLAHLFQLQLAGTYPHINLNYLRKCSILQPLQLLFQQLCMLTLDASVDLVQLLDQLFCCRHWCIALPLIQFLNHLLQPFDLSLLVVERVRGDFFLLLD